MNKSISLIRLAVGVLLLLLVITFTGCIFFAASDTGIAVPNLTVKGAPSNITALSLRITGPGMAPVESYYSSVPSSITVEVPAGVDRQFELIAYIGPSNPSAATSFKGKATVDLAAGETKNITLNMIVNETKLVIPDATNNYAGGKLLQIDDITGGNSKTITGGDIGLGTFTPYDVDFDSQGRIYIANNAGGTGTSMVLRIDNMDATSYTSIADDTGWFGIRSLAIDRPNELIYYSTSTELYRWDIGISTRTQLTITGIGAIRGMAVDKDGILYIAGNNGAGANAVFKYDPDAQSVVDFYDVPGLDPWDVMVKTPYLYVANNNGTSNNAILQLDLDLNLIKGYGDEIEGINTNPGQFYGPHRFLAILNKKLTILDDDTAGNRVDKLVSIDDMNGTNWTTMPTTGDGQSLFTFFELC